MNRQLTKEEQAELDALNRAVEDAIATRKAWLDKKMVETSELQVGDEIWNVTQGMCLGVVTKLYRVMTNQSHGGVMDDSVSYEYEYKILGTDNWFDNTSRQSGVWFGTKQNAVDYYKAKLEGIERS